MAQKKNLFFENSLTAEVAEDHSSMEWFSSEDAAKYLRIPEGSVRNLVSNGRLKVRGKIGRLNRYHIDDLRELLARK